MLLRYLCSCNYRVIIYRGAHSGLVVLILIFSCWSDAWSNGRSRHVLNIGHWFISLHVVNSRLVFRMRVAIRCWGHTTDILRRSNRSFQPVLFLLHVGLVKLKKLFLDWWCLLSCVHGLRLRLMAEGALRAFMKADLRNAPPIVGRSRLRI